MSIASAINAGSNAAAIASITANRQINLGTSTGGLDLTAAELDLITAGVLRIGNGGLNPVNVSSAVAPVNSATLTLLGSDFSGPGSITVANLRINSGAAVTLNGANDVDILASNSSNGLIFTDIDAVQIGTADSLSGLNPGTGGLTLTAGGITQTSPITQSAGGGAVSITSNSAAIVLTNPSNNFTGPVTLSNTGTAASAAITDANDLILAAQSIAQLLTVNAPGAVTQTGAFIGAGGLTFNGPGTLTLSAANSYAGTTTVSAGTLNGTGSITAPLSITAGATLAPGTSPGLFSSGAANFSAGATFVVELDGLAAGTQHDQLAVTGAVNLGGATLAPSLGFAPAVGDALTIIANDGADTVIGTFAGLPEDALVTIGGSAFRLTYAGGDGNDVVLTATARLDVTLAANFKSATFTDTDGDLVKIKTSRGTFEQANFIVFAAGALGGGLLALLDLGAEFARANITVTAKTPEGGAGDGFVTVDYLEAIGVDLGKVKIDGPLGEIDAGDPTSPKPAIKSLTIGSLGGLGSELDGRLGKLTVQTNIEGGTLTATGGIGPVKIKGNFFGGELRSGADLGPINVTGNITSAVPVIISAFGKASAPDTGSDLAIKSLTVGGTVTNLQLLAGYDVSGAAMNADASIGPVKIQEDLRASSIVAGVDAGADSLFGTLDDAKIVGGRDNDDIASRIAGVTVKGTVEGTADAGDNFGIVAEQIAKLVIGGDRQDLKAGVLALGTMNDFFAREDVV